MTKKIHTLFIFTYLGLLLLPLSVFSAVNATVTLYPQYPPPNSPVQLTLTSYSFDVNQSDITWTSGGKELLKGLGEKKLTITTGGVGTTIPIHVTAVTSSGDTVSLDVNISPQSVSLLYESEESYTPLFYEGASLPSEGALVKFVAVPNISVGGVLIPPSQLSYLWYVNDAFIDDVSGAGKNSANLQLSILTNSTDVKVIVHGKNNTTAEKTITVTPHQVLPLLYSYDDILGVKRNSQISRRFETTKDFSVSLEPYYLSTFGAALGTSKYAWSIDGSPVSPVRDRVLTVVPKADSFGSSKLTVSISNTLRRLQSAIFNVDILYDTRK